MGLFHGGAGQLTSPRPDPPFSSVVSRVGHLWPSGDDARPARSSLANPSSIKCRNPILDPVSKASDAVIKLYPRWLLWYKICDVPNSVWAHLGHTEQYFSVIKGPSPGTRHQHMLGTVLGRTVAELHASRPAAEAVAWGTRSPVLPCHADVCVCHTKQNGRVFLTRPTHTVVGNSSAFPKHLLPPGPFSRAAQRRPPEPGRRQASPAPTSP